MASKAELARQQKDRQRQFFTEVQKAVLDIATDVMVKNKTKTDVRICYRSGNRYINFSQYGKKMNILLYTKGQIVIQLEEACHNDYETQLFEFDEEEENQDIFLEHFKEVLHWLISEFLDMGRLDFHSYMDYVSHCADFETAYETMVNDYQNEEDI